MNTHLEPLAHKYLPVKFARMDAEKAPFFVSKLQIVVLPTVVLFRDGVAVDRIVGFEELAGGDDFTTAELEKRLKAKGVLRSLTREGREIEGDEEDERARQRAAAIRSSAHSRVMEMDDEFSD
jgi:thioredoxin-like negative regulator of GroEL